MKKILKDIRLKLINISVFLFAIASSVNVSFASRINEVSAEKFGPLLEMINTYAQYFSIFITILALFAFIYNVIRLGTAQGNSGKREEAIRGLMISGAVAALVPFSGVILFIFLNFTNP